MPKSEKQKFRAIEILRILQEETDYEHPLTTKEFCEKLAEKGYSCDRRTLSEDVSDLIDLGYSISSTAVGKQKGYFYDGFLFTPYELKVLIDAVQASSFIPEKRSQELMNKLAKLAGYHQEEVLKGNMITFNTRKHKDESVMFNVEQINQAISQHKKISFQYYDLDENKKRRYRKNRKTYKENPVALIYNDDNYYLMCFSDKYQDKVVYRVDRMYSIVITDEDLVTEVDVLRDELPTYTKQAFRMFGGDLEEVTLQFDRSILGQVYDQFGEEVDVTAVSENLLETTVQVQISPTFFGWVAQFGNKLMVMKQESVNSEINNIAEEITHK